MTPLGRPMGTAERRYRWFHMAAVAATAFAANAASASSTPTRTGPDGPPRVPFTPPDWVFLVAWPLLKASVARADLTVANLPLDQPHRRVLLGLRAVDWALFASFTRLGPRTGRPGWILASTCGQATATGLAAALGTGVDRTIPRLLAPQAAWLTYATAINAYGAWHQKR